MRKKWLIYLLALTLVLVAVLGMLACTPKQEENGGEEEQEEPPAENYDVNYYLAKVNSGLNATVELMSDTEEPLSEYTVESEYTFRTGIENYTLRYSVSYGANAEKNKYYLYLFDNVNHINRVSLYYDSADLYLLSDGGRYKISDFNTLLLYGVFREMMDKVDLYRFFYGEFMRQYFRRGSLLTNAFSIKDIVYNLVGTNGEAVYFKNGDFSILISTLNDRIEAMTEGIGTSFDSVTYNMLGFKLSKLIEYTFNSINVEEFTFLLESGRVYETNTTIKGRMLDGSDYFLKAKYNYSTTIKPLVAGEEMKTTYSYDALSPGTGSFEGEILFPTIRPDQPYLASLDYDLNAKDNSKNRLTFRIYDQLATETEVTDKYGNISEFLSLYYVDEYLYINADGLCKLIGTPVALESLHLPKIYLADMDMCAVLQVAYGYLIRIMNVLVDFDSRTESKSNRELFESLMEAISSPDLKTLQVEVTEELIKDIRGDETPLAFLVSRWLTGKDETLSKFLPNEFFQLLTIFLSYKFVDDAEDLIIIQGVYDGVEYFNGTFYRIAASEIVFPSDLNDLYYTLFVTPEVVTLDYDVTLTPYHTETVDASKFFGIFIGDGTGKNTPCVIQSNESISVRGKVSESYNVNAFGERVTVTTVSLSFYKTTAESETLLMSLITNPAKSDELLVNYRNAVGLNGVTDLRYRIPTAAVKSEMEKLTDEDNIFLSESNFAILFGLMSSLGGNSETYVRDNRYVISIMTDDKKDPVKELIGISDTFTVFRIKVSFAAIDLSSVSARDYSAPYIETLQDVSVRSIYSDNSKWKESVMTYVNSIEVPMYLTYTQESTEIVTGKSEYTPTAYLYGKEVSYKLSVLDTIGTYLITDVLTEREAVTHSYAYKMINTGIEDKTKPQYLLVIDPAYTRKLPETVDVRYETFEVGSVECAVEGFIEGNITREGYNLAYLAGDFDDAGEECTLRIGINSIATYYFSLYVSVLNRNVISYKENEQPLPDDPIAYINNEKSAESTMSSEVTSGTEQVTVLNKKNIPVVGVISVDPYTYAMHNIDSDDYDLIASGINEAQMCIRFYGYYGTRIEKDEKTAVESEYKKYYNKEGYNYIYLADRISSWDFDYKLITWQGGVFYAIASFGSDEGYPITVAIRIAVKRKEVAEVRIDDETNSRYTIDYLIRATYSIPTTSVNGHIVTVVFKDGSTRKMVPTKPGTLSNQEYYEQCIRGSLAWEGMDGLASRITVQGTSSLFGSGQNATSETRAAFADDLGVGSQKIILNVLQPSRYQSSDEETSTYLISQYSIEGDRVDPVYRQIRISNAKFHRQDEQYASFDINPYDYSAALPTTVWLYVNKDSATREWKEYSVVWKTTDKEGNELNLIKERNGRYVLAYPSTEERRLVVYGQIGDGNGYIWVAMIVRNLFSELQSVKFYSYAYEKQTVMAGENIPGDKVYYEYITDDYVLSEDERAVAGKEYYSREIKYETASFVANTEIVGSYYENVNGAYVETEDTTFRSYKTYYKRVYSYTRVPVSAGDILPDNSFEYIEEGYGVTLDSVFASNKTYYLYVMHIISPENDIIYVDPYVDYEQAIPTKYEAVLGSGAVVTSEDLDENGDPIGLTWFIIQEGESEEYPLIRSGKFLNTSPQLGYNQRYDDNGRYIFSWNAGNLGLKCYIVGSDAITNEATLLLNVYTRELYKTTNDFNKTVNYIDIYNNDDDIYTDKEGEVTTSTGIYSGTAVAGFTDVNCYQKASSALLNRFEKMHAAQINGEQVYIGVRFSSVDSLYSLPVTWDVSTLNRIESILKGNSSMEALDELNGGIYLTGTICKGKVNEQTFQIPFSIRKMTLSSVKMNNAGTMLDQRVYSVVNDENQNALMELNELRKVSETEYIFTNEYLAYIGSDDNAYNLNSYSNILYFELGKAFALSNNREGYFCTPYEYLTYIFNGLTLTFEGGIEELTAAGGQMKLFRTTSIESAQSTESALINYFNRSVLGLEKGTQKEINGKKYSYSFVELYKFSEGSAVSRTMVVIRAELSSFGTLDSNVTIEPFTKDLKMSYGVNGYALPTYEEVRYTNESKETYIVRYRTAQWTPSEESSATLAALGRSAIQNIPSNRINIIEGATYNFIYTLPVSGNAFRLNVKIPRKDIAETGYQAKEDIYVIQDGVLMVKNPFLIFYYDRETDTYRINESRIPTTIYANVTTSAEKEAGAEHVYESTGIDSYEITWNFVYSNVTDANGQKYVDASLFSKGGYFLLAQCQYDAYYINGGRAFQPYIRLYVDVAKLDFYGIKMDKKNDGVTVTESDAGSGSSILLNNIEIDPYDSDFGGTYNIPQKMTLYFTSLLRGEGDIVEYTFDNLLFEYDSGSDINGSHKYSGLDGRYCRVITYDQNGHTMSKEEYPQLAQYPNTVYLRMWLSLDGDTRLRNDITLSVTILSRNIEQSRVYNNVYENGTDVNLGETLFGFSVAAVTVDNKVPANTYYVYDNGRYTLTTDEKFATGTTYYVRSSADAADGSLYRKTQYYQKADVNATGSVYSMTKAVTNAGEAISTTYYKMYEVMYKPEEGNYLSGADITYYEVVASSSLGERYSYNYTYGCYVKDSLGSKIFIIKNDVVAGAAIEGEVYRLKVVYFPEYSVVRSFRRTADRNAVAGKTYYELSAAKSFADKASIGTEAAYFAPDGNGLYVQQFGQFKGTVSYYTFSTVSINQNEVVDISQMGYYEETFTYELFAEGSVYYVPEQTTDPNEGVAYLNEDEDLNLTTYTSIPTGDKTYRMRRVSVVAGYRQAEDYYVYTSGRYEKTKDTYFNKTTAYYIFRETTSAEETYSFFEGYENTSFYAMARSDENVNVPVYYVDPYNTSTFSLPIEVSIKFRETSSYKSYDIRGWEYYENGVWSEFISADTNKVTADENKNLSYAVSSGESVPRFYKIAASVSGTYYGYFLPQKDDFGGGTYLIRGYISVGEAKQYFNVIVVVLNRSLRITDELGRDRYDLSYDFDDPVAALLSDIPSVMGSAMFVSYDSYYLDFSMNNVHYTIEEKYSYSYNNGNIPVIPTILWQESWEYNGERYDFSSVSLNGYDGSIYGNVYADDHNLKNLYTKFYADISEEYITLVKAWMWDIFLQSEYSGKASDAIRDASVRMEEDIIFRGYDILCNEYSRNVSSDNTTRQQYYTYITQDYFEEMRLELQEKTGELYTRENNMRTIILYMYEKMGDEYRDWVSSGSPAAAKAGRPQIYEDWTSQIDGFKIDLYLPTMDNNLIEGNLNEYQKLKAYYYDFVVAEEKNNFTSAAEKKYNKSYYDRYWTRLQDCIKRDIWTKLAEYGSIFERRIMDDLYIQYTGGDTYIKSSALSALLVSEDMTGVSGENTEANITIPVLEYSKLNSYSIVMEKPSDWESSYAQYYIVSNGKFVHVPPKKENNIDKAPAWDDYTVYSLSDKTIQFNLFDFQSINEQYVVEFHLTYDNIYKNRVKQAEQDVVSEYREDYAAASLRELENVLIEKGINVLSPTVIDQNGESQVVLEFTINDIGKTYSFTYQEYMNALCALVEKIDSQKGKEAKLWTRDELYFFLMPYGTETDDMHRAERETILKNASYVNYYVVNSQLWSGLYNYYLDISLQYYNQSVDDASCDAASWNRLYNTYAQARDFSRGKDEVYFTYYNNVVLLMDELSAGIVNGNYVALLPSLKAYIKAYYPEIVALDLIYHNEQNVIEAYSAIADGLIENGTGNKSPTTDTRDLYKRVQDEYDNDNNRATAAVFIDMYDDLNGLNVIDLLSKWERLHVDNTQTETFGTYSYQYTYFYNDANYSDEVKLWKSRNPGTSYAALGTASSDMFDFLVLYVANNYLQVNVKEGDALPQPNRTYYVRNSSNVFTLSTDTTFSSAKTYFIKGVTPFDYLYENASDFGFTKDDIDMELQWIMESDDTFLKYLASLRSLFEQTDDNGKLPIATMGFSLSNGSLENALARMIYFKRFYDTMSSNSAYAYKLRGYSATAAKRIKMMAVQSLLDKNAAITTDARGENVLAIFDVFFADPGQYDYAGNSAVCCLTSQAFIYLLKQAEQSTAGAFLTDYENRRETYADTMAYTQSKAVLDELVQTCVSQPNSGTKYSDVAYVFVRFYRMFLLKNDDLTPAYTMNSAVLGMTGETVYYPTGFYVTDYSRENSEDILCCDDYFGAEATKLYDKYRTTLFDGTDFSATKDVIVDKYLKNYPLRAILYYYDNIATEMQKVIVDEVARIYVKGTLKEENCLSVALGYSTRIAAEAMAQNFFIDLLGRHDLGAGFRDQLYNAYYSFYLEEGYAMLEHAAATCEIDTTSSDFTTMASNLKNQLLSISNGIQEDAIIEYVYGAMGEEGMAHRNYRRMLRSYLLNTSSYVIEPRIAEKKSLLKNSFVTQAYAVYYSDEHYKTELDSILEFIVDPGVETAYQNAIHSDDVNYQSVGNYYFKFVAVSSGDIPWGEPINLKVTPYYVKDDNLKIYRLTTDSNFLIGQTYYRKTDANVTIGARINESHEVYIPFTYYADEVRYDRVKNILESTGTGKTKDYPSRMLYYSNVYEKMRDNIVEERLAQFNDALDVGIEKSVYQDIYDSLFLLTLSAENFAYAFAYYINLTVPGSIEEAEAAFCSAGALEALANNLSENWWKDPAFATAVRTVLGRNYVSSDMEDNLITAIFTQQKYSYANVIAKANTPRIIYNFLQRMAYYRDGTVYYENKQPIDRGYLTTNNILYNDYSEVTAEYKYYYVSVMLYDDEFMSGVKYLDETTNEISVINSVSFMQSTFQTLYKLFLDEVTKLFLFASQMDEDLVGSDNMGLIKESLSEKGFTVTEALIFTNEDFVRYEKAKEIYNRYLDNVLIVMSHTSVYSDMASGSVNPLKEYFDRTYRTVVGTQKGEEVIGTSSEDDTVLGRLTLAHYLRTYVHYDDVTEQNVGYDDALGALSETRTVVVTFYSADHLSAESDEEKLRHVVYFDAGRSTVWSEFETSSEGPGLTTGNKLTNARVYFANAYKTKETVTVRDIRYYNEYISAYVYDFTTYVVTEDKNLPTEPITGKKKTKVEFSNGYHSDALDFVLIDISQIHICFEYAAGEEITENDVIVIDVLNPVLPTKAHAYGYVGNKQVADLGYITDFTYSDIFYRLPFDRDENLASGRYSRIIANDPQYYLTVDGKNGRTPYHVQLTVRYLDRSIDKLYSSVKSYSKYGNTVQGLTGYYDLYGTTEAENFNIIYIRPNDNNMIRSDHTGYLFPSELYVRYGGERGDMEYYSDIKWDESVVNYSLSGTNGYVDTRILSYRLDSDDGYYVVAFDYNNSKISLSHYTASNELFDNGVVEFALDGGIDWHTKIYIENLDVVALRPSGDRDSLLGELKTTAKAGVVIDCSDYKLNQFYPEYPSELLLEFRDGSYADKVKLEQSSWQVESESDLRGIIQRSNAETTFVARFNYMGYWIRVLFGTYDIDLRNLTDGNSLMNGGTIYLVQGQDSADKQIEKNYSLIYFNFGTEANPDWKKVPLYIVHSEISASSIRTYVTEGAVGVNGPTIIDNNISFTIEVISPKLFARLESELNNYVIYDYFSYAHDNSNVISTSQINTPASLGSYFSTSADSTIHFNILESEIRYDFMKGIAYVPVLYNMSLGTDPRIALDANGTPQFRMEVQVPLYSYLNNSIEQNTQNNTENVFFDRSKTYDETIWTWATDKDFGDSIYWTLGKTMHASDLPGGITTDTSMQFNFYWDLSNVNVNLATEDGYIVQGYYYTSNGRWATKELRIYINKLDVTDTIIRTVNGNNGIYIDKVYDAKFFELNFDSDELTFLRENGERTTISADNFTVEYRLSTADEDGWSADFSPINVGVYYIRLGLTDYNYLLKSADENGIIQPYVTFMLTISPYNIDITDMMYLNQITDSSYIDTIYNGHTQEVVPLNWYRYGGERNAMFIASFADQLNDENKRRDAEADVYDKIYDRSTGAEKNYMSYLYSVAVEKLAGTDAWNESDDAHKEILAKAYVFEYFLTESPLPYVNVDRWFEGEEKETLYRMYKEGRGPGTHSGIKYSETEAKSIAYLEMYNRVNDAAKSVIRGWYDQTRKLMPLASETEINAYVYTNFFPAGTFTICEVKLHIEYMYGTQVFDSAPSDVVDGGYRVEISIVPADGNFGNYISLGHETYALDESDAKNGVGYVMLTLNITKDTSVEYEVINNSLDYNGKVQNPSVFPVTDEDGGVATGVTIRYEYHLDDGLLVVERTSGGSRIVKSESTSQSNYAGIRDVGVYHVVISVDGGNNYISTDSSTQIEIMVAILPADIFIEVEDLEIYYQQGMATLADFVRIHNGTSEYVCETCGATLEWYETDDNKKGVYRLVCPNCQVKIEAEFSHNTTVCYCNTCVRNRLMGKPDVATLELVSSVSGVNTYRFNCPLSKTSYLIYHNLGQLLGSETVANLGELILATDVEEHYPLGTYEININGLKLDGAENAYTVFGGTYYSVHQDDINPSADVLKKRELYGFYTKLELLALGNEGSLYADSERFGNIIQMFSNYNIYVRRSSAYKITTPEGAIGVANDDELADELDRLSRGDTAVIYLTPKRANDGTLQAYAPIVIDKEINLTLIGYYNAETKDIESVISGITLKRGTLNLRIVKISLTKAGVGLEITENAGTVRINECHFTVDSSASSKDTTGIHARISYKEKISIGGGTILSGLTTGVMLEGGDLEVKESVFNNNGKGIHVASDSLDVSIRSSSFTNHMYYGVLSENENATILDDEFNYNGVGIKTPEVLNADMYKNTFVDAEGNYTNTTDIVSNSGKYVRGMWQENGN